MPKERNTVLMPLPARVETVEKERGRDKLVRLWFILLLALSGSVGK